MARKYGIEAAPVQHHEAHVFAVMLEHGLQEAIGFAWDGTGYGADGAIWGSEGFAVRGAECERLFQLEYYPLVGNEQAIREPARLLQQFLMVVDPAEGLRRGEGKSSAGLVPTGGDISILPHNVKYGTSV